MFMTTNLLIPYFKYYFDLKYSSSVLNKKNILITGGTGSFGSSNDLKELIPLQS